MNAKTVRPSCSKQLVSEKLQEFGVYWNVVNGLTEAHLNSLVSSQSLFPIQPG